jgi:hypothetical protein
MMRAGMIRFAAVLAVAAACAAALAAQPAKKVEMDNGLLKVSYDRGTRLWSLSEFASNDWQPVIAGATSVLRFREADSLAFHLMNGDPTAKLAAVDDSIGKGRVLELRVADGRADWSVAVTLYDERKLVLVASSLRNMSGAEWKTREFRLLDLHGAAHVQYATDSVLMHVNGYQSWSGCRTAVLDSSEVLTSHWSALFYEPLAWRSLLFGFLTNTHAANAIRSEGFDRAAGEQHLSAASDIRTVVVPPGGTLECDPLLVSFDASPNDNLRRIAGYQQKFAPAENKPFTPSGKVPAAMFGLQNVPSGWCSWYYYYDRIGEDSILQNVNAAARRFKKAGLQYIQIDDGFQIAAGDWNTNTRFPHGHRWLVDQIHAKGFMAGLWLAPFAVAEKSTLAKTHRDWLLRDERDSLREFFTNDGWGGRIYGLDPSIPAVQLWLENLFYTVTAKWGYDYVKIDFLYFASEGAKYRQNVSSAQAYQMGLRAIRKGAGPDKFILGCGAPIGSSIGFVDGMRIGTDVAATWDGVMPGARAAAERFFYHNAAWYNDPDCLLVRDPLSLDQARAWAAAVALSGQMNLLSDKLAALPEDRIDLLARTLPTYGISADPVDLVAAPRSDGLSLLGPGGAALRLPRVWKFAPGDSAARKDPSFDDASWGDMPVPSAWEREGYPGLDSMAWYRVTFDVPADWPAGPATLALGRIDDCDEAYLNGAPIGATGSFPPAYATAWTAFRRYAVPGELLRRGAPNTLALRVFDGGGDGGLTSAEEMSIPAVWNLPIVKPFGKWNAVGVFNWSKEEHPFVLSPERLGLSARKRYVAYEYWSDRYLGEIAAAPALTLAPSSCRLLAVHETSDEPFILSTSRHLTQGAVDVADARWNGAKRTLAVSCDKLLPGSYAVILYVPPGMRLDAVRAPVRHSVVPMGETAVKVLFEGLVNDKLAWQAVFQ